MSTPLLPIEVEMIKAAADFEEKQGAMTDRERVIFQCAFVTGSTFGIKEADAIFEETVGQVRQG